MSSTAVVTDSQTLAEKAYLETEAAAAADTLTLEALQQKAARIENARSASAARPGGLAALNEEIRCV